MFKYKIFTVLILMILLLVFFCGFVSADDEYDDYTGEADMLYSDDNEMLLGCYDDKYTPFNPVLKLTIDVHGSFESCCDHKVCAIFFLTNSDKDYMMTVNIKFVYGKSDDYDIKMTDDGDLIHVDFVSYLYDGENIVTVNIYELLVKNYDFDDKLYCIDDDFELNSPEYLTMLYDYCTDEVGSDFNCNSLNMDRKDYCNYFEKNYLFATLYFMDDSVAVTEVSIICNGLPSALNIDLILIAMGIGVATTSGYGLYKRQNKRLS